MPWRMPFPHRKPVECPTCTEYRELMIQALQENQRLTRELEAIRTRDCELERAFAMPDARKS